jgi:hypothetical protein
VLLEQVLELLDVHVGGHLLLLGFFLDFPAPVRPRGLSTRFSTSQTKDNIWCRILFVFSAGNGKPDKSDIVRNEEDNAFHLSRRSTHGQERKTHTAEENLRGNHCFGSLELSGMHTSEGHADKLTVALYHFCTVTRISLAVVCSRNTVVTRVCSRRPP